jgi:hypothetical protein
MGKQVLSSALKVWVRSLLEERVDSVLSITLNWDGLHIYGGIIVGPMIGGGAIIAGFWTWHGKKPFEFSDWTRWISWSRSHVRARIS